MTKFVNFDTKYHNVQDIKNNQDFHLSFIHAEYLRQLFLILSFEISNEKYLSNIHLISCMKNLTYLIQQNYLICCDYMLNSDYYIPSHNHNNSPDEGLLKIRKLILTSIRIKSGEHFTILKHNNDSFVNTIKTLIRSCPKNELLDIVANYSRQLNKLTFGILGDFSKIKLGKTLFIKKVSTLNKYLKLIGG